jgi:hypothetical protein
MTRIGLESMRGTNNGSNFRIPSRATTPGKRSYLKLASCGNRDSHPHAFRIELSDCAPVQMCAGGG